MDESNDDKAFSDAFMDRLAERRRRVLLGVKLVEATKAQLEWELAGARALIEEYEAVLADAMSHKIVADKLNDQLVDILKRAPELIRSKDARDRAFERHKKSPAADHKRTAREWFDRWCKQTDLYATKEEFIDCFVGVNPDNAIKERSLREWLTDWSKENGVTPWRK